MENESIDKPLIFICGLITYFLEKSDFWFDKNAEKIVKAGETQSFFQDNTILCQTNQELSVSAFLRKLDEMGYEKVISAEEPGEFSKRGGIIDVFPINLAYA